MLRENLVLQVLFKSELSTFRFLLHVLLNVIMQVCVVVFVFSQPNGEWLPCENSHEGELNYRDFNTGSSSFPL